ncbi:glycosyltransferase family 20 protein [Sphaerobolus stellatus SS14]|uniref:Glycosyltransferase family 20 protein n=1 Tax=Sphaerobolus stellatus (strain SS14) TaxID=990650 RepID=A0A0C9UJE1_SPHS4|nr:glycosyltransferase family 20 protein [Sphaerobolus stellatus SS14]
MTIDTFSEPYARDEDKLSLTDVRDAVHQLEQAHKAKGTPLSGRIIQVTHYLPIIATFAGSKRGDGLPSPPVTPNPPASPTADPVPISSPDVTTPPAVATTPGWSVAHRSGHDAMVSGVKSLSDTHDQVLVGWTGDILSAKDNKVIHAEKLTDEDKQGLDEALKGYKEHTDEERKGSTSYKPVWLADKIAHKHYEGYSKHTLWPLFHYLLWQDVASELSTDDSEWKAYVQVNHDFADAVLAVYRPGDLIWVHDYHLLLVPKILRTLIPDAHIGLFIHTPFPSSEVFRCLPRRKEILDGILGANLVCFQTYSYSRHFTSSCIRVCGYESSGKGIEVEGHIASVMYCPVGIDAERVAKDTLRPGIQPKLEALTTLYEGKKIIVGRDKLDVVRGVLHKLRAFEKLLTDYPQWRGNVVLIQVTSPSSSDSPKLERQVSELVSRINGEFGSLDFIPVHHYHQHIKKDEFYALLSVADLGVITPLRDGMNTTSMEFVIAQEKTKKSPLVLSEFMGITGNMKDSLQVNPWNLHDVAAAINRGLTMSPAEKAQRHASLYKIVTTHTSHHWAAVLLKMLLSQISADNAAHQTPYLDAEKIHDAYRKAGKRLMLFDYDGTLTPIVRTPAAAVPSQDALEALVKLTEDPKNIVYIISGRDSVFLLQHLGHITKMGLSAEHGCFVREPASEKWMSLTEQLDMSWMEDVKEIFQYYTERTTGSHIEVKKSSITWHYRASDPEWGLFQCRQCLDLLENNLVHKRPIEVLVGKKNLEVRPLAVNKGEIVKRILYQHPDAEFIFCAGDDKTDEDMFRALNLPPAINDVLKLDAPVSAALFEGNPDATFEPVNIKIRPETTFSTTVGASNKKTLARWHVTSPQEVIDSMLGLVRGEAKL